MAPTEDPGYAAFSARGLRVPRDIVTAALMPRAAGPNAVLPWDQAKAIEAAAEAAHRGDHGRAEQMRRQADYGDLGRDPLVPPQAHLLTDNDPLD